MTYTHLLHFTVINTVTEQVAGHDKVDRQQLRGLYAALKLDLTLELKMFYQT